VTRAPPWCAGVGSGGEAQAAGCSHAAGVDERGVDEAGSEQVSRAALEVDDRGGGEQRVEALGVAEVDDRAGESGAFDGCVELVEDPGGGGGHLGAGVDVVGLDRVEQVLEVGGEQLRQGDREREVEFGELDQLVEQFVQFVVIEVSEPAGGVTCVIGEVRACEIVLGGAAVLSAAAFDLAA